MKRFIPHIRMHAVPSALLVAVALLAGCSQSDLPDTDRLPDGLYPITLTAAVEGQTVTRATVDNTWAGTEEVALQVGGEVKKYTVATDGVMTVEGGVQYWTNKTMTVQAWHSPQGYSAIRPASFTVKADQNTNSGAGYQQSDMLYTSQSITYNATTLPQLTFKHLPVKVVVNLSNGDGVTETDVQNATVTFINQALTSGAITYDDAAGAAAPVSVAQAAAGNVLTPKVSASATSGYQKTVEALLVPQQMQGRQFVKIMVGSGAAARTYYYVPKDNAANLEHGNQYTYYITVKKEKLEVTASSSVSWTDDATSGDAAEAVFHVTMPDSHGQTLTLSTNATSSGNGYNVTGSSFTISYTVASGDELKGFPAVKGLCDVKRTYTTNSGTTTYTFTYSNIRSDLWLSYTEYAEVGDFYYNDGTWLAVKDDSKNCIGIVFKRGVDEKDAVSNYMGVSFQSNTIHGYVVALTDAVSGECSWGKRSDAPLNNISDANNADYNGYGNTKKMIDTYQSDTNWDTYAAFKAIVDYRTSTTAPTNSSNWYLPSLKQLADVYAVYQNAPGNVLYDRLNSISSDYLFKEAAVGQNDIRGGYWTSTEYNGTDAWYVRFADSSGVKEAYSKGENYIRNSFVRAILTF